MELSEEQRLGLNTAISEAACLALDVDEANAIVRVTLEVLSLPVSGPSSTDRTLTLTLSGVGRIAASLRSQNWNQTEPVVEPLALSALPSAVNSFGGAHLHGWEFIDLPESSWTQWGHLLSLDTTLSPDSAPHVLELSQEEGASPRELDLRVWFRAVEIRDPAGNAIPLQDFIDGGVRWWTAHDASDPRTKSADVAPPL